MNLHQNKTRLYFLTLAILLLPVINSAQNTFYFKYDASGNRISRSITLKSATMQNPTASSNQHEQAINEMIGLRETKIFPNPTQGVMRIEIGMAEGEEAIFTLYDINGKVMLNQATKSGENTLNLSNMPSGIYLLHINVGKDGAGWKIIKE